MPNQADFTKVPKQIFYDSLQERILPWLNEIFSEEIVKNKTERNHRFLEEALELVQACSLPVEDAHRLVDYVYGREVGYKNQEVGGVMITLGALCLAWGINMHEEGEIELSRINQPDVMRKIQKKQAEKPILGSESLTKLKFLRTNVGPVHGELAHPSNE